jgi:hypothetical protein
MATAGSEPKGERVGVLTVFPAVALGAIYLLVLGWRADDLRVSRREALIGAWAVWGALLVAGMELLSRFAAIGRVGLAGWWIAAILAVGVAGWRRGSIGRGWRRLRAPVPQGGAGERLLLAALFVLAGLVLLTAAVAPPNNVDSLNHHMVRVVRWAQQGSLEPFATLRNGQVSKPPFAELAILNNLVLTGSDRLSNLVQWIFMGSSLVVVSLVARQLRGGRADQLLAACFAFSIPLGLLLASNTKNDHVATFWVLCLASLALASTQRALRLAEVVVGGLVLGLGLLTKGTFQVYGFLFLGWLAFNQVRHAGWRRGVSQLVLIVATAALLNAPYWWRNIATFGGPFGNPIGLTRAVEVDELGELAPGGDENVTSGPAGIASVVARRVAGLLALNTIFPEIGAPLRDRLQAFPALFPEGLLASLNEGLWNHEDSAGNLLHLTLLILALPVVAVTIFRNREFVLGIYLLAVAAGYGALTLVSASTDLWGLRYQLTFFFVAAPLVGVAARQLARPWLTTGLTALLLMSSLPYVALNNTRPLVAAPPRTRSASVLTAAPFAILTNALPALGAGYEKAAEQVRASGCPRVAVGLHRGDLEYILWWLFSSPQSGVRIETLEPSPETARFSDPNFQPCAVVCTTCGSRAEVQGLPLTLDLGYVKVYQSGTTSP